MFILSKPEKKIDDGNTIRIVLPFKDQIAANAVRRHLRDLSRNICVTLHVICAMQIISVIRPDTSINALPNKSIPLSVNTF